MAEYLHTAAANPLSTPTKKIPWMASSVLALPEYPYPHLAKAATQERTARDFGGANEKGAGARWSAYLSGLFKVWESPSSRRFQEVRTGDLIPAKPSQNSVLGLVQARCGDDIFYIMCFEDTVKRMMQREFPKEHVFVPGKGFLRLQDARKRYKDRPDRYLSDCEMANVEIPVQLSYRPAGYLTSYAGFAIRREWEEWNRLTPEDVNTVISLAKESYKVDAQSSSGGPLTTKAGHHWLDLPSPARMRCYPKDVAQNALPMGWEAHVLLLTGEVVYFDRLGKDARETHPVKHYRTEGLPRMWQFRWAKIDGVWVTFFQNHDTKQTSVTPPSAIRPGLIRQGRKGGRTPFLQAL